MVQAALIFTVLFSSLQAFAQTARPAADGPILYSHYEFSRLTEVQRIAYLKMIRELLIGMETDQTNRGVTYGNPRNAGLHPLFNVLLETADAQSNWIKGGTCVFAGGFSTYGQPRGRYCVNNRPCEDRRQIACNPLLYGNICTRANDGATKRCEHDKTVTDEELAKILVHPNKREEWDAFKDQFDGFCIGVMKEKRDINYKSCERIEARIKALEAQIALIPPARPQGPPLVAPPAQVTYTQQRVDCAQPNIHGCLSCSGYTTATAVRELRRPDLEGKYAELIDVMAGICGVNNAADSGNQGVSAKTTAALIQKFGACKNLEYPGAGKFASDEQKAQIAALVKGHGSALQEAAGGRWYNPPYTEAIQDYFGISVREARQAFCTNRSASEAAQVFGGYPEFAFLSGTGASVDVPSILKDDKPLTHAPAWANEIRFQAMDGANAVDALNRFKSQYFRRQQLAKCLQANDTDKSRRQVNESRLVAPNCVLKSATVTGDQLESTLVTMFKEFRHVGIEVEGQRAICCPSIDSQGRPSCVIPKAAAKVSAMDCAPQSSPMGQTPGAGGAAR